MRCKYFLQIILFSTGISACVSYYYQTDSFFSSTENEQLIDIKLNPTFQFYIREVYTTTQDGLKSNKANLLYPSPTDLIEVEYLLISKIEKTVIYMATVPDKYQAYYGDPNRYLGHNYLNVYDLKKICFGSLISLNEIKFTNKKNNETNIWNISYSMNDHNEEITLNTLQKELNNEFIDIMPIEKALEEPFKFKEVKGYKIIFYRYDNCIVSASCTDNTFHIRKIGNQYEVFFEFDNQICDEGNKVYFDNTRIPFTPIP